MKVRTQRPPTEQPVIAVQKDLRDDETLVSLRRRASLANSLRFCSNTSLVLSEISVKSQDFQPACSPGLYLFRFKPINRLCRGISSLADGRAQVRPHLRGHMTELLTLSPP